MAVGSGLTACTGVLEWQQPGDQRTEKPKEGTSDSFSHGVVHRLTRTEYNNTVRDLFGTALQPADSFPPDVGSDGFDNSSGSQSLQASHLEAFEQGADRQVSAWFADPALHSRVLSCELSEGQACIRKSLETFLPKAWRRPVTNAELDRLMGLAEVESSRGGSTEEQLKLVLRGALLSPYFLFRIELDESPTSPTPHRVSDHELASRLSYFLWSTMPDDALFALAAKGSLQDDKVLGEQVERMLAHSKAQALIDVFAAQWLELSRVKDHNADTELFPNVTDELKVSMEQETKLFFQDLLNNAGSIQSLLVADYAFVNGPLAEHYGLVPPSGTGFERVSLASSERIGGVLGQASFLTHTSGADETSPVRRGDWVLTNILCSPPPPPPPGVSAVLPDPDEEAGIKTVRDRLAAHRADPTCAGCHDTIDPIGLGLENYDPVGAYREMEGQFEIDASGQLPGGATFDDAHGLVTLLAADARLAACVAKKLFTFALGRAPNKEDSWHIEALSSSNSDPISDVLRKLILSEPFRSRRGESTAEGQP